MEVVGVCVVMLCVCSPFPLMRGFGGVGWMLWWGGVWVVFGRAVVMWCCLCGVCVCSAVGVLVVCLWHFHPAGRCSCMVVFRQVGCR